MTGEPRPAWWRGARGEWYVAGQFALLALLAFGPRTLPGLPSWPGPVARLARVAGLALAVAGAGLVMASVWRLGASLTALPAPRPGAALVETGPYRFVRHPIYAGLVAGASGFALFTGGWLTLGYAAALFALLDRKSAREERWLAERHPGYADYRRRVRRLIPFVH